MIIEEIDWKPRRKADALVEVKVEWGEADLGRQVKQAGGKWNPAKKMWEMRYDWAVELGLEGHIKSAETPMVKQPKPRPK